MTTSKYPAAFYALEAMIDNPGSHDPPATRRILRLVMADLREASGDAIRYEALRKCDPRTFGELYERNRAGERFDDLVDELVRKKP